MSHSKRNTSRAVFTSHERAQARAAWSSTSARLTRESFLPFGACRLCLAVARDPVACASHGDVFCRECALADLLAQRGEIERAARARDQAARAAAEQRAQADAEADARAVQEFEATLNGLDAKPTTTTTITKDDKWRTRRIEDHAVNSGDNGGTGTKEDAATAAGDDTTAATRDRKRKFELDPTAIAEADRAKARKALDAEAAAKPTLPSFWTPSLTPGSTNAKQQALHDVAPRHKTTPMCPAAPPDAPHPYSLHTLVRIQFSTEEDGARVCPSCKKVLSNASRAMLAKPCGHVVCRSCVDRFMRPSHDPHAPANATEELRCYVCETDLTFGRREEEEETVEGERAGEEKKKKQKQKKKDKKKIKPGLVELRSEGTGFSAGGANQVKKDGVAFQC
ncbi:hypothetical protein F4780DRAFT_780897 [Xylariomycetidae sp. FL0641]|nr:hypothetical protein F4780DRAFT_780897 [Xylariomycetidae sp. FL0641]